eukprot:8462035-Pyramimonas_sp.AAC.1
MFDSLANAVGVDLSYFPIDPTLSVAETDSLHNELLLNGTVDAVFITPGSGNAFGRADDRFVFSTPFYRSAVSGVVTYSRRAA